MLDLLPKDTRNIEFLSAVSLIVSAVLIWVLGPYSLPPKALALTHEFFWASTMLTFGFMQLIAAIDHVKMRILRSTLGWFCGAFWTWWGLDCIVTREMSIAEITSFTLGIFCFYVFVMNSMICLRRKK